MTAGRAADHDDIDRSIREQFIGCRKRGGAMAFGELSCLVAVVAANAGDRQAGRHGGASVRVADVAGADQPDVHTTNPSCSRYRRLSTADSFGVRASSGTRSSSTIAQPRNLTSLSAAKTPLRSTVPRPSSTKR